MIKALFNFYRLTILISSFFTNHLGMKMNSRDFEPIWMQLEKELHEI